MVKIPKWSLSQMHVLAGTDAKWRLFPQTFAGMVAMLCRGGCKRLQGQLQCFASEKGKTGIEIATPILDKRKDGSIRVTIAPRKYLLNERFNYHDWHVQALCCHEDCYWRLLADLRSYSFYVTDKREKYCKCYGINDKFHPILNVTTQHPHCYAYNQTDKCKEHEIYYSSPMFHKCHF